MLTRKSRKLKHWDKGRKCEYHSENLSQVRDISKKTVPKYKIDILIQKGIFTRRRFVCDDCLNMYGRSEDSDDIVSN